MDKVKEPTIKCDSAENWKKAINFVPKKGEIIVYMEDGKEETPLIKIGNGISKVSDLKFINESPSIAEDGETLRFN